jgi:hypothetical protein
MRAARSTRRVPSPPARPLKGHREALVPHGDCANAVGAATAQIRGETDQVYRDLSCAGSNPNRRPPVDLKHVTRFQAEMAAVLSSGGGPVGPVGKEPTPLNAAAPVTGPVGPVVLTVGCSSIAGQFAV